MTRSLAFAIVLLLALLAAASWWFLHDTAAPPTAAPATANGASDAGAAAGPVVEPVTVDSGDAATASQRSAAEGTSIGGGDATGGTLLRVIARWPDGAVAEGVMITLRGSSRAQGFAVLGRVLADAEGLAVFADVPVGKWSVRSDRGDRETVEVENGEQEFVFELEGGIAVDGVVVDPKQQPVGGASVWLQTRDPKWSGGRVLTTTGPDGRFALRRIPKHVSLGAFAAGHTRSELVDLDVVDTDNPPVEVTLELHPGGCRLTGIVVDASDRAIAGALVGVGKQDGHLDMRGERIIERWSVRTETTDEAGRFTFVGLPAGETPIAVRAAGYGFWRSACDVVDHEVTEVTVRMQRSGTITGIVRDGDGEPMAGAVLSCYDQEPETPFIAGGQIDFDATFGYLGTTADDEGAFRLSDVTAGTAFVFAQPGGRYQWGKPVPYAREALEVAPEATVEWHPVVSDGNTIEGVVWYGDGMPMPNVFVTAVDEKSQQRHVLTNDKEGVFRFTNLDASRYTVSVQYWDAPKDTPALQLTGVVPNRGRIELRAPFDKPVKLARGTVIGRVDDVGGRIQNAKAAHVTLMSDKGWFRPGGEIEAGAFRFENVEPCRFRLGLMEDETALGQSDWFELQPGAMLDAGVLRTEPPGALHITLQRDEGTETCEPKLYLRRADAARSTTVIVGREEELQVPNLTPGEYTITGYAEGMVAIDGAATVTVGTTSEVHLRLLAGRLCRFEVWIPEGIEPENYAYTITRQNGTVVKESAREWGQRPTRPFEWSLRLPDGRFVIEFSAGDLSASAPFTLGGDQKDVRVRLDLAK